MSLKNLEKMLRKSPASDARAAVLENAWALSTLQNWVYFNIFSYLWLFFVFIIKNSAILCLC